jgi:hypothetical protein
MPYFFPAEKSREPNARLEDKKRTSEREEKSLACLYYVRVDVTSVYQKWEIRES